MAGKFALGEGQNYRSQNSAYFLFRRFEKNLSGAAGRPA
jgi:hypothetical protein